MNALVTLVIVAIATCGIPGLGHGQVRVQKEADPCKSAIQRSRQQGTMNARVVLPELLMCGSAGDTAISLLVGKSAARGNAFVFSAAGSIAKRLPDGPSVSALIDMAANEDASEESRIHAMAALFEVLNPRLRTTPHHLKGGIAGKVGFPKNGCVSGRIVGSIREVPASPAVRRAIVEMANQVRQRTRATDDLHSAAVCLAT